ncbi:MAG: hypothetical protein AB7O37_22845 [Vicinamibacteria bacterium]
MKTDTPASAQEVLFPHRVFVVSKRDILEGHPEEGARPTAWRYVIDTESEAPTAAEVADHADFHRLAKIVEGPLAQGTMDWVARLQADESASELELNALRVPELGVFALWLRGPDGSSERFIPLRAPASLGEEETFEPKAWWDRLKALAEDDETFDDRPEVPALKSR